MHRYKKTTDTTTYKAYNRCDLAAIKHFKLPKLAGTDDAWSTAVHHGQKRARVSMCEFVESLEETIDNQAMKVFIKHSCEQAPDGHKCIQVKLIATFK